VPPSRRAACCSAAEPADFAKIIHAEIADYRALAPKIGIVRSEAAGGRRPRRGQAARSASPAPD
jgi:hypothetical protein